MKVVCDKCLIVEDADHIKDWLRVKTDYTQFLLCPVCADGFWQAVDHKLPHITTSKKEGTQ